MAICSGLHVKPNIPHIKGIESVPVIMHSSEFEEKEQFGVVILGTSETRMDISYMAVTSATKSIIVCYRDGSSSLQRQIILPRLSAQSIDYLCSVSRYQSTSKIPISRTFPQIWDYYTNFVRGIFWLISGTKKKFGSMGGIPDQKFHSKSSKSINHQSLRSS